MTIVLLVTVVIAVGLVCGEVARRAFLGRQLERDLQNLREPEKARTPFVQSPSDARKWAASGVPDASDRTGRLQPVRRAS